MVSLAGTKPACRRGKTTISILGEKYGREIQTEKIEKEIQMKQFVLVFCWETHDTTVATHTSAEEDDINEDQFLGVIIGKCEIKRKENCVQMGDDGIAEKEST